MNRYLIVMTLFFAMGVLLLEHNAQSLPLADNTLINQRDRLGSEETADKQGQTEIDLAITQQVRKAIVNEKTLSLYGHNIKIITNDGMVTLKGPVTSEVERKLIENIASDVVGMERIQSKLEIVTN